MYWLGFWVLAALTCVLAGADLEAVSRHAEMSARALGERGIALRSALPAVATLAAWALARVRSGPRPPLGAARALAVCLAALGLGCLGADLVHGGMRTLAQHWSALHAESFERLVANGFGPALRWPPAGLSFLGFAFAWRGQRPVAAPRHAAQLRRVDVSKTLAYLESLREWPQGGRKGDDR